MELSFTLFPLFLTGESPMNHIEKKFDLQGLKRKQKRQQT